VAQGRTVVFGALLPCVLLLILAQRDPARAVLHRGAAPNPWLPPWRRPWACCCCGAGHPRPAPSDGAGPVGWAGLAAGAGVLALCLGWLELLRLAASGRHRMPETPLENYSIDSLSGSIDAG
jgi:Ca2+-transporting ATPase